jgi:hypothetical protein
MNDLQMPELLLLSAAFFIIVFGSIAIILHKLAAREQRMQAAW